MNLAKVSSAHIAVFLIGAGVAFGPAAFADAYSTWRDAGTVGGHSYQNQSVIFVNSGPDAQAVGRVRTTNGSSVPPGYMGSKPTLYKGTTLCHDATFTYNNTNATIYSNVDFRADCGTGSYLSQSASSVRRADGTYKVTVAEASPYQTQTS